MFNNRPKLGHISYLVLLLSRQQFYTVSQKIKQICICQNFV